MAEELQSVQNEDMPPEKAEDTGSVKRRLPKQLPTGKTIGIFSLVLVIAVLISVFLTFALTQNSIFPKESEAVFRLRLLTELIDEDAYFDYDEEKSMEAALRGYVNSLDDAYAVYYNQQEYQDLITSNSGMYVGIGISVQHVQVELMGKTVDAIKIVKVNENSGAMQAGLLEGDLILAVVDKAGEMSVSELSYSTAISMIKGEVGTSVTLSVLRRTGNEEVIKQYTVKRMAVLADSVKYAVSEADPTVGIISITGFDIRTPEVLSSAMDTLIGQGIRKFVIDLRNNPGGDLDSVVACASFFLENNDLILTKEFKSGESVSYRAVARTGSIAVAASDIGKYRDYDYVVLINKNTASAAEILTSVFRDYELGTLVGDKTYGKGIVQTVYALGDFGAVKFTTSLYYPPNGVCYHAVGIEPNEYEADSEKQMAKALEILK